jgi:hypothetical protein
VLLPTFIAEGHLGGVLVVLLNNSDTAGRAPVARSVRDDVDRCDALVRAT